MNIRSPTVINQRAARNVRADVVPIRGSCRMIGGIVDGRLTLVDIVGHYFFERLESDRDAQDRSINNLPARVRRR